MKGKKEGRNRTRVPWPQKRRANSERVAFRSTKLTPSSTASPLELHERRCMGRVVGISPVDHPRGQDTDRRPVAFERPHLDGGSVATEQVARLQIEGVLHIGSRVVERGVERFEVVPLRLRLGPPDKGEAERAEDGDEVVDHLRDGVASPGPGGARRESQV